jgi:hypothetical protein
MIFSISILEKYLSPLKCLFPRIKSRQGSRKLEFGNKQCQNFFLKKAFFAKLSFEDYVGLLREHLKTLFPKTVYRGKEASTFGQIIILYYTKSLPNTVFCIFPQPNL